MMFRDGYNKMLFDGMRSYRRRNNLPSDRQAVIALMTEAGYNGQDTTKYNQFGFFLRNKRRPKSVNMLALCQVLRIKAEKVWGSEANSRLANGRLRSA